jgi:phosphodiesterase/alkaline phosphatase D-like protein
MSARRVILAGLVTLGVLGGTLAFSGALALAQLAYGPNSTHFGELGSGNGQFAGPNGVAVDDVAGSPFNGDVYVSDYPNGRVEVFDASGHYLFQFNGAATPNKSFVDMKGIAVDNSTSLSDTSVGDVYVVDSGAGVVDKFSASGEYISEIPSAVEGVTVDSNGNVWVSGWSVGEFGPSGEPITAWGAGFGFGIAVDAEDNVYVNTDRGNTNNGGLVKRSSTGADLGFLSSESSGGIAFDSSSNYLFFPSYKKGEVVVVDPVGNPIESFGSGILSFARAVAVNVATGTVYVADLGSDVIRVFPALVRPDVSVGAPSNVQRTSVTLNGTVTPDGFEANPIQFEYGPGQSYGTVAAASPPVCPAVSPSCPVSVNLTGLKPETTYHYRLDASDVNGTDEGRDVTFTTPPPVNSVSSSAASGVTATTATLNGSLAPDGVDVHYYFQYGPSASYGLSSPAPPETDAGTATGAVSASTTVSGLEPNATYHFRLIASDSFGRNYGADETFTTQPAPPAVDGQSVSALTQTSAIISASVEANNQDTTYHFEYGSSAAYGTSFPSGDVGSGFGDVNVGVPLTGLQPGGTYHFRVVAANATGTTYGPDQAFTTPLATPPTVNTGAASGVTANAASLSGTVDPQGVATVYEFDIGADSSYGTRMFAAAGSGSVPESVTVSLQGLAAGATYHYRLVASNVFGTVYGADQTFTTPGFPSSLLTAPLTTPLVPTAGLLPSSKTGVGAKPAAHPKKRTKKKKNKRKSGRKAGTSGRRLGKRRNG